MLWSKVHSHLLLRACLLSSKRKLPPQACQDQPGLPSVVCHLRGVQNSLAPCTSVVRVFFQTLEPTAFLVHPVLAAIAEDAVAAHSSATDGAWKFAWTLQEVQSHTADHNLSFLHLLSVLSSPLLLSMSRASWHIPQAIQR